MNYMDAFNYWKTDEFFDKTTRDELAALDPVADAKEIEDRFYRDLEFGTGGLRGVMSAGTNRMNKYTVGKATKGLADYLLATYGADVCRERGVVIGYDTRNNSRFFAETAANVLSAVGIRVYLHGYKYSTMSLIKGGKNVYHAGSQLDPMLRAFFTDICDRPSCYACPFKKRYRVSDMTIWDCFSVYDFDKTMDDDKGTTRVLCHSNKAVTIMQELSGIAKCKQVEPDKLVSGVKEMYESVPMNPKRKEFFDDVNRLPGTELFGKYYPITTKTKVKTAARKVLLTTGAYGVAKKCLNKLRGR